MGTPYSPVLQEHPCSKQPASKSVFAHVLRNPHWFSAEQAPSFRASLCTQHLLGRLSLGPISCRPKTGVGLCSPSTEVGHRQGSKLWRPHSIELSSVVHVVGSFLCPFLSGPPWRPLNVLSESPPPNTSLMLQTACGNVFNGPKV